MAAPGRLEWIDDPGAFAALEPEWNAIAEPTGIPFLRHEWFRAWWEAFGEDAALRVCTFRRGGRLAAVVALCSRGPRLEALSNGHTPVFRPLSTDPAALTAVVDASVAAGLGSLVVTRLPADDPAVELLARASRRAGRVTWVEPDQLSPYVETSGTFDGYRAGLKRTTRKELDRVRRKLLAEHDATFAPLAEPDDLDAELTRGLEVEAGGWKGRRGSAILDSPEQTRFYRDVARCFAERGALRLSTLQVNGRAVAFDLCLVEGGRLWVPKGAYEEAFRRYAPGLLLTLAEIERAFELGLSSVELLGDADTYKLKFATGARPHRTVHSYRRLPRQLARYAYRRGARPLLKRAYRRALARGGRQH